MTHEIKNWSIAPGVNSPYVAPEAAGIRVFGEVFDHPRYPGETKEIVTSRVVGVNPHAPREFSTESGSTYLLVGPPEAGYLAFLAECGRVYDADAPIKVIGR
jgi:hypothetical protein